MLKHFNWIFLSTIIVLFEVETTPLKITQIVLRDLLFKYKFMNVNQLEKLRVISKKYVGSNLDV